MTKTVITTVTKPDGTTSTTTETFLYPAMMKDASVQTIELYEPCDYVPTKPLEKKDGKKTGQKERKKPEEKKEKNNEKKPQKKEEKKKATSKPKKEEKKEEKKTEMQEEKTPISRVEAVLKKTKSVRPISPLLSSSSSSDSDSD